jgi:hypothetical protein
MYNIYGVDEMVSLRDGPTAPEELPVYTKAFKWIHLAP